MSGRRLVFASLGGALLLGVGLGGGVAQALYTPHDTADGFTLALGLVIVLGVLLLGIVMPYLERLTFFRLTLEAPECSSCEGLGIDGRGLLCRACDGDGVQR